MGLEIPLQNTEQPGILAVDVHGGQKLATLKKEQIYLEKSSPGMAESGWGPWQAVKDLRAE